MTKPHQLITILGPTASGKTSLAARLAYELDGEIISGDSRQVYRGMTIGTGKDLDDYTVAGHPIPYHLIDICEPGEKYNIFQYQQDFLRAWHDVISRSLWGVGTIYRIGAAWLCVVARRAKPGAAPQLGG